MISLDSAVADDVATAHRPAKRRFRIGKRSYAGTFSLAVSSGEKQVSLAAPRLEGAGHTYGVSRGDRGRACSERPLVSAR